MEVQMPDDRRSRCGRKRPKSMESAPDLPKKPKMKLKAQKAVRSLINLLRVKDKRKGSLSDDLCAHIVAEENINTKPLSTLSAFFSRNPLDGISCAGNNKDTLSKSWAYFENEFSDEISIYEISTEENNIYNYGEDDFGECYFEDDYCNDYYDNVKDVTSFEKQAGRGIIMGVSILQSLTTGGYDNQMIFQSLKTGRFHERETLQTCLKRNPIRGTSPSQRRASLPNFTTRCEFSPAPHTNHLKKETATVPKSHESCSNMASCFLSEKSYKEESNTEELTRSRIQSATRNVQKKSLNMKHTSSKLSPATGKPPKQISRASLPDTRVTFLNKTNIRPLTDRNNTLSPETKQRPSPKTRIRPATETRIRPSPESRIRPSPESRIRPSPESRIRPSLESRMRHSSKNRIRSLSENRMLPSLETRIRPSTESRIRPSPETRNKFSLETRTRRSSETRIRPPPETRIMPSPETRIGPSPETKSKPLSETRIIPSKDTKNRPSSDTRIKPSIYTRLRPSTDVEAGLGPLNKGRSRPSTDAGIRPLNNARSKPSTDTKIKSFTKTKVKPSKETKNRPSNDPKLLPSFASLTKSDPVLSLASERNPRISNKKDDNANSAARSSPKIELECSSRLKLNFIQDLKSNLPGEIQEHLMNSKSSSTENKLKGEFEYNLDHHSSDPTCNFVIDDDDDEEVKSRNVHMPIAYQKLIAMPNCKLQGRKDYNANVASHGQTCDVGSNFSVSPHADNHSVCWTREELGGCLVWHQTKIKSTPVNKIPTPLSTSSPMPVRQMPSGASREALSSKQGFVSPVRGRCKTTKLQYSDGDSPRSHRRRRRRKYLQQRLQVCDTNDSSTSSSDVDLENTNLSHVDYLLLKKAADVIVKRISNKKEIASWINKARLVEYLRSQYMSDISKLSIAQTISSYKRHMVEYCKHFMPTQLSQENCLPHLLASVLINSPKVINACGDYIFENLHFLISVPKFLHISPELMLMLLSNDKTVLLGRNGFPLAQKEAEREVQRIVKRYLHELKTGDLVKDSRLDKMFMITHSKAASQHESSINQTRTIVSSKRPKYDIAYRLSEKRVDLEGMQKYSYKQLLPSDFSFFPRDDHEKSARSVASPNSDMWNYCNASSSLRKMFFSYKRQNEVPYITQIILQFAVRGKKVLYSIGDLTSDGQFARKSQVRLINQQSKSGQGLNDLSPKVVPADSEQVAVLIKSSTLAESPGGMKTEHGNIMSPQAGESNAKRSEIKLTSGEHVTGVMVQETSGLHNIMFITNTGRYIRAHGILEFPSRTGWTLLPPPEEQKYCLQALYATSRTDLTGVTCLGSVGAVWAVLSPLNNMNQ